MKKEYVCEWTDLLAYADNNGYDWNTAHDMLVKERVVPMYETHTREIYVGMGGSYGYSDEVSAIIDGFLKSENVDSCIITQ